LIAALLDLDARLTSESVLSTELRQVRETLVHEQVGGKVST
jgi:hypothetical protein